LGPVPFFCTGNLPLESTFENTHLAKLSLLPLLVQALEVAIRVVREQQLPIPINSKFRMPRQK
jgi:hypothetical protein